jgi:hypothetical protein
MNRIAAAAVCAAGVLLPATAGAQSPDAWQFGASIYGWLPSIKGTTTFPPPPGGGSGSSSDVTVDAADIIDSLKFVLMGTFEARKGRWGGFTDFIYMDLGNTKSQTRDFLLGGLQVPADVSGSVTYDMKSYVWTLAGEYRAVAEPGIEVDTFLGARMIDVTQTLNYSLSGNVGSIALPDRSGSRKVSMTNWDAIVGVKGRYSFGAERQWFVPYYADIGTGDSDLTYQLMTGVGYSFKWGEMVGFWRYLDYDLGGAIDKMSFSGPGIALNFRW